MWLSSRRRFLKQATGTLAFGFLGRWPADRLWAAPATVLTEPDEALLRELALVAVDAARGAGATFSDVRVSVGHAFGATCRFDRRQAPEPRMVAPGITMTVSHGVRAVVAGAWGVATGFEITPDAVADVAHTAVMRARANRPRRPRELEWAPAPTVEDGRWATPIDEDPFAVRVGDQADAQLAALAEVTRRPEISFAQVAFGWQRSDRVFASSEGTLQVQRIELGFPSASVSAAVTTDTEGRRTYATEPVRSYGCASGAGTQRPTVQLPNLSMEPGEVDVSVDELIADTERGFFVEGVRGRPDHQILNGQFGAGAREIRDGKLGDRVRDLAFQFITPAMQPAGVERRACASRHRLREFR